MGGAIIPALLGGAFGLAGASKAASAQKRATQGQRGIANRQGRLFDTADDYYAPVLDYLARSAGLQLPGGGTPSATAGKNPGGEGSLPTGALGIYGSNPTDAYQFRQAEEDLARARTQREQQLRFRLGRQGAGEATLGSALARNESDYLGQLGQFRRQQAIRAPQEQERRIGALLAALQTGFGQGQSAAGIFGGQAGLAAGQLGQSGGLLSQALSDLILARIMRQNRGTPPIVAGNDPLNSYDPSGGILGQWWNY